MIDLNYKKHQLVLINEQENDYICLKCNNKFWYQDIDSKNHKRHRIYAEYKIYSPTIINKFNDELGWVEIPELSCDEILIKNIIE